MPHKKNILLFSTLNPYPFWAGSENLWFDFVTDKRVAEKINVHAVLADSPVTRSKAAIAGSAGVKTSFYNHFNVNFTRRNLYRASDRIKKNTARTLPWYNEIKKGNYSLVWFNVAALQDLQDLAYAVSLCKKRGIPYWLLLQHGYEDFFLTSQQEVDTVTEIVTSAKRFVFISQRNRYSLERAIGCRLNNALHTVNAIPAKKIEEAKKLAAATAIKNEGSAKFFNLGRFSPKDKAQHLLLEALTGVQWKSRDWQLSCIGVEGFGKTQLEMLIQYYGLDKNRIQTLPHISNPLHELVKNDVLLMPSLAEGTPFAMIETMACARPAVGTPIGGIPELINEQRGWLSKTVDVADINDAMEKAWQQRSQWQQMGNNAQQFIASSYNQDFSFTPLLQALTEDSN